MTSTKNIIGQADEIVGINPDATSLDAKSRGWLRRGAYFSWVVARHKPVSDGESLSDMAARVVRIHAASKPKGDGLPESMAAEVNKYGSGVEVQCHEGELGAVQAYMMRCLSPATRRFLAAFDVFGPNDAPDDGHGFVVGDDGHTIIDAGEMWDGFREICWLVPRASR